MKLKIIAIITFSTTLFIQGSETQNKINIRSATLDDLKTINKISNKQYQTNFKSMWQQHYASMTPSHHTIDSFVEEKITLNATNNKDYIIKQLNKESDHRLLIAELINSNAEKKIVGFCRFEKKDIQTMYIHFILVNQDYLKQGIAKQLAHAAMNTFDGVTQCNFRALVHYNFINNLYTKHNCIQKGTIALDPNTGKISTNPNAPVTHIDYSYQIKK